MLALLALLVLLVIVLFASGRAPDGFAAGGSCRSGCNSAYNTCTRPCGNALFGLPGASAVANPSKGQVGEYVACLDGCKHTKTACGAACRD